MFFFFCLKDTATPEIYPYLHTLSLPDALPIWPNASAMSVTRPIVAAPGKWTILWTASRGAGHANYRGFTHRCPRNRGSLPRISGQRVVKGRQNCESGPSRSDERRVGKESVSTCRYRGSPYT